MHFIIAFIAAIALMSADHYSQLTGNFRSALLSTINPIEQVASVPKHVYQWATTDFTSIDTLKIENQKLKTEILLLKAKQQQFANLEMEVDRLESLLGTTGKMTNQSVQIATVTYYSSNPLSQFLTVNRGYLNGISAPQTVIDSKGIMGQIITTTPTSSRVLLITDPDHQIPVRIQRTGQRGILSGTGHDTTKLGFIPKNSQVQVGDILESSGLGGLFPAGYPVATISQIEYMGDNPYLEITAQPIAQLHQSNKVLIISKEQAPQESEETNYDQ